MQPFFSVAQFVQHAKQLIEKRNALKPGYTRDQLTRDIERIEIEVLNWGQLYKVPNALNLYKSQFKQAIGLFLIVCMASCVRQPEPDPQYNSKQWDGTYTIVVKAIVDGRIVAQDVEPDTLAVNPKYVHDYTWMAECLLPGKTITKGDTLTYNIFNEQTVRQHELISNCTGVVR